MKKNWNNPELKNLSVENTNEGAEPLWYHPNYPECEDPTNTGDGYQKCKYKSRPCKYFGVFAGGFIAECNAPSNKPGQTS